MAKLLLASPTFYPFYGGAEIRFRRYLPMLSEYDIESSVITGTPKAKKITEAHKKEAWYQKAYGEKLPMETYQNIDIVRYRLPERPANKRLGVYHEKIRDRILTVPPDVIQFLSPFHSGAIDTFKLARKKNIGTVVAFTLAKSAHPNVLKQWLQTRKIRKLFSIPDCIVVSSEEIKSYLLDRGVKNLIEVIANGVDTNEFTPARDDEEKKRIRHKLGMHPEKKILLNVGTVHPRKGTDLLLGAFKLLVKQSEDVDLYIAGPGVNSADRSLDEFKNTIEILMADPEVKSRVHFVGLIDNVSEYMKASDVFVFPSREEGMGNVVMEAMASGVPVVVTPYLGFPSVFGRDEVNFKACSFNNESISENIKEVLYSDSISKDIVAKSLHNVRNQLSIQKSVTLFSEIYNRFSK